MNLRDARKLKQLSQEKVSRLVNISLKHYQNIEYGIAMPTVNIALHICEVLEVDPRTIEEWKDRKKAQ